MGLPQSAAPCGLSETVCSQTPCASIWKRHWDGKRTFQARIARWPTATTSGPRRLGLSELQSRLFAAIPYDWQAARVDQQHPEMFSWLGMLDLNVDVIVGLMVLISIINMTSALLIII